MGRKIKLPQPVDGQWYRLLNGDWKYRKVAGEWESCRIGVDEPKRESIPYIADSWWHEGMFIPYTRRRS